MRIVIKDGERETVIENEELFKVSVFINGEQTEEYTQSPEDIARIINRELARGGKVAEVN